MRLIDADQLFGVIAEQEMWNVPDFVYESIKNAPTVDAVSLEDYRSIEQTVNKLTKALADAFPVKHGHWVYVGHGWAGESICKCSICGHHTPDDGNYCSNCGAKMDAIGENDV